MWKLGSVFWSTWVTVDQVSGQSGSWTTRESNKSGPGSWKPISITPGLKFCSVFVFYILIHFVLSLLYLIVIRCSAVFCNLELHVFRQENIAWELAYSWVKLNHLSSNQAQFLTLLTMGASFWLNDKALWIAKPGHVTVSIKLLHLRFSLLLSHFQPIFVLFVVVSAVLSCMLFNSRPCQNNPDRSSMICECRSFGWFEWLAMIGDCVPSTSKQHPVTTSTKACPPKYSHKLLKPCWSRILTSDMALKQDKRPDEMVTNNLL